MSCPPRSALGCLSCTATLQQHGLARLRAFAKLRAARPQTAKFCKVSSRIPSSQHLGGCLIELLARLRPPTGSHFEPSLDNPPSSGPFVAPQVRVQWRLSSTPHDVSGPCASLSIQSLLLGRRTSCSASHNIVSWAISGALWEFLLVAPDHSYSRPLRSYMSNVYCLDQRHGR
jgi:hypothetical protein